MTSSTESTEEHPHFPDLAVYALGALDPDEVAPFEAQLAGCPVCRQELARLRGTLDGMPPELFLDGPPANAELMVRRAVRAVRPRRARVLVGAAAAAVVLAVAGGVVGRTTAPSPPAPTVVAGTRTITGTSGPTELAATLTPAAGWVRLSVTATGIAAGQQCTVYVLSKSGGPPVVAGSWLVSKESTTLQGSALVAPADVASVQIRNAAGDVLVTATA